jgi:hypothetical protein
MVLVGWWGKITRTGMPGEARLEFCPPTASTPKASAHLQPSIEARLNQQPSTIMSKRQFKSQASSSRAASGPGFGGFGKHPPSQAPYDKNNRIPLTSQALHPLELPYPTSPKLPISPPSRIKMLLSVSRISPRRMARPNQKPWKICGRSFNRIRLNKMVERRNQY